MQCTVVVTAREVDTIIETVSINKRKRRKKKEDNIVHIGLRFIWCLYIYRILVLSPYTSII